jgi:hypothetical protein
MSNRSYKYKAQRAPDTSKPKPGQERRSEPQRHNDVSLFLPSLTLQANPEMTENRCFQPLVTPRPQNMVNRQLTKQFPEDIIARGKQHQGPNHRQTDLETHLLRPLA